MLFAMKHRLPTLCSLVFLLFTIDDAALARLQAGLTPIYSGYDLTNFYWSADSSLLVFQKKGFESGVELGSGEFLNFDVSSQTLDQTTIWPLQPSLSAQEQQAYMPKIYPTELIDYANENDFMFLSPNQRYMVYVADAEYPYPVLAIADRQTVEAKIFDVLAGKTLDTDYFFALWSANSESVVVGNHPPRGDVPRYFYISDFTSDIQEATIQEVFFDVTLNNRVYGSVFVEDISQDGQTLLISALDLTSPPSGSRRHLYLATYTFSDPPTLTVYENTSVREQNIMATAFDPNDERYLLALTQEGIQRYDTLENTWTIVNADINPTWVDYAAFSPDGQYMVVQDISESDRNLSDVYVIDVSRGDQ